MPDPIGLALAVGFIALGLLLVPLNDWLDKRQKEKEEGDA